MAKRVFRSVVIVALLAVLLTAGLLVPTLYGVYEEQISSELRLEAEYIVHALNTSEDKLGYFEAFSSDNRVTLISADGTVLYDSAADAEEMENHAQRPEVVQALAEGSGESMRHSDTLSETTIYYACRTADGDVLRIANMRRSVLGIFLGVAPQILCMMLAVVLLSMLIAHRSARRIVSPINDLNLDAPLQNETYDELAPLLTRMDRQHAQISRQVQALEKARAEMAATMENMREGMVLLDTKNAVLSMNESAARIFDADARERIGKNILSISRDAALHDAVQTAQGGSCCDTLMSRNARTWQIFASPVRREDEVQGIVLLILDVTERFAAEASRREFTANVSHELKTPLTSISGYAEIIRDGIAQPQDVQAFAGKICAEAGRLVALVNDILELSRLDEKQGLGQKESVELKSMLQGLCDDFSGMVQEKRLSLALDGEESRIEGYSTLLREMFFNLIDNAVKYTPEGGKIDVCIRDTGDCVECSVADNGVGIPKEHQEHVFERFYRVDKSHSRATGGTGLGLAIVKHVAEIHHAGLRLESAEQKGTVITLRFPK